MLSSLQRKLIELNAVTNCSAHTNAMIPLHVPQLSLNEILYSPEEDYINLLEERLCRNHKKTEAVFTGDGRNALFLALKTLNLARTDEILIPAYICESVNEVIKLFCKPIYVDIDKRTFNISPSEIEKSITKNTRAILVAHIYGNPCDMSKLKDIAEDKNLTIIEDVAQSLNGTFSHKPLGSFGDFAILSFRFTKDITSFRGGALLSNKKISYSYKSDPAFKTLLILGTTLAALSLIRYMPAGIYAPTKNSVLFPFFKANASKFRWEDKTLSNYQCFILYKQLMILNDLINVRRKNAEYYTEKLKDIVLLPKEQEGGQHTYFRYTIQTPNREQTYNYLMKNSIEADKMYDYCLAPLPNSLMASTYNLNIPVHHRLTREHLNRIVEVILEAEGMG